MIALGPHAQILRNILLFQLDQHITQLNGQVWGACESTPFCNASGREPLLDQIFDMMLPLREKLEACLTAIIIPTREFPSRHTLSTELFRVWTDICTHLCNVVVLQRFSEPQLFVALSTVCAQHTARINTWLTDLDREGLFAPNFDPPSYIRCQLSHQSTNSN